jgi:hypothetical protein
MPTKSRRSRLASPSPSLGAAFKALAARLHQMEDAFNRNTQIFSDGIKVLEIQNAVLRRIINDVVVGEVHGSDGVTAQLVKTIKYEEGGISVEVVDFNAYLKEHLEHLAAAEAKAVTEKANGHTATVLASPDDDSPIIFGGSAP